MLSHGGGIDGFTSAVRFLPKDQLGVVVLTNSSSPASGLIASNAVDRMLGLSEAPWAQRALDDRAKAREAQAKAKAEDEAKRKRDAPPTHKLKDYTGQFEHPSYQTLTISQEGEQMRVLYDLPIPNAEPHYAQIIRADRLKAWDVYPEVGWDPHAQHKSATAVALGGERIERRGNQVEIFTTVVRSHFKPEHVELNKGDHVVWHLTNVETAKDATHGFALAGYNINLSLEPGESTTVEFEADMPGTYAFYCTEFCSALHLEMLGYMLVKP